MRKALLFAPMLMLLLTACGGGERDPAERLQEQYAAVTAATLEADVTCHYDDEVREYTLLCAYTPESSTVTVLAPANLAGISATVAGGEMTLSYDDVSLDAGTYSSAGVSPVTVLPRLMEAAARGYARERSEETVGERSCLRLSCDLEDEEGAVYTTWFDQETFLPLSSEVSLDGTVVFEVAWSRFEVTGELPIHPSAGGQDQSAGQAADQTADQAAAPNTDQTADPAQTEAQPLSPATDPAAG